jgi:hypothetical protein
MRITTDGGTTWNAMPLLDNLMTGGGVFRYRNEHGATAFTGFNGYPQPTLVAIDPQEAQNMVAGAADAGLFLSRNGGVSWRRISNPLNPTAKDPHIPRPRYVHFDHDMPGLTLYVGTQGRGIWRVRATTTSIFCPKSPFFCGSVDLGKLKDWQATCVPRCPPWWQVWLDKYNPQWNLAVVDTLGNEVPYHITPHRGGAVLSFRPQREDLALQTMQSYSLLVETDIRKKGTGQKLPFTAVVKTGNKMVVEKKALDRLFNLR